MFLLTAKKFSAELNIVVVEYHCLITAPLPFKRLIEKAREWKQR